MAAYLHLMRKQIPMHIFPSPISPTLWLQRSHIIKTSDDFETKKEFVFLVHRQSRLQLVLWTSGLTNPWNPNSDRKFIQALLSFGSNKHPGPKGSQLVGL